MKKILPLFFTLGISLSTAAHASLPSQDQIDPFVAGIMKMIKEGATKEAAKLLLDRMSRKAPAEIAAKTKEIEEARKFNESHFGKLVDLEKVRSCKLGKFLFRVQWVLKHERGFVHWNFTFYSAGKDWYLDSYRFANDGFVPLRADCG